MFHVCSSTLFPSDIMAIVFTYLTGASNSFKNSKYSIISLSPACGSTMKKCQHIGGIIPVLCPPASMFTV